ncbi:hypothetical protein Acr_01g0000020 [Actinidia rufa]|uniref:VQ domain-containing protein n=1 Tax=Actinidia rufa TaxID=165716 RepID=A0A7J0E104_9ERIC|nr:hypothetical protein Acr_01g0000020 [Actinidia rufa]
MQPPESSDEGSATPPRRQLQGPRPPQLRVRKESHAIRKTPQAAPPPLPPPPVIIYAVSPKVIHTTVSDFMSLVQRLTGSSSAGDVSPAARLASIERTSPTDRAKDREILISNDDDDDDDVIMGGIVQVEGVRQIPGILSPAPATLPPISPGFFAPAQGSDPYALSLLQDQYLISPFLHGNMFMPSPSTLFSAPIVSPSPSSFDLFNPFFDF